MKEKILPFIIGLLVGAIIATGCFYLYNKTHEATIPQGEFNGGPRGMEKRGERPELPEDITEEERQEIQNEDAQEGKQKVQAEENRKNDNTAEQSAETDTISENV